MCVNYTNMNKACPKDPFPLPRIDQLIDGIAGCSLLSFINAFRKYHQIYMHHLDEEKTTFITSDGVYCYRVMPFVLKNVGVLPFFEAIKKREGFKWSEGCQCAFEDLRGTW